MKVISLSKMLLPSEELKTGQRSDALTAIRTVDGHVVEEAG